MEKKVEMQKAQSENDFSGTVYIESDQGNVFHESWGYANRSDRLENNAETRYGIASGCKLFTAIAVCQLVEQRKLEFESTLGEVLPHRFEHIEADITIHQLLTHTSGVPDYFDEEVMEDFEELWIENPMYQFRSLQRFLPLFENEKMKFPPGERFHYNNAGYILLGLIVEEVTEMEFAAYVRQQIFEPAGMNASGYYSFDMLPANTALGYIEQDDGTYRTNIYSLPAKGGSDGGAYVTVKEMASLWRALLSNRLLSRTMTEVLLSAHTEAYDDHYGYGVWIDKSGDTVRKYHIMGYDPGVSFHSSYYPDEGYTVVVCSNKSEGAFEMLEATENSFLK